MAESEDLRGFFLDLFDQALDAIGTMPDERQVDLWIDHATRLFAELESPAIREVRGLWGELLVILQSRNPELMLRRWHEDPNDRFDFLAGEFALEVKSCRDLERVHQFELQQVRPLSDIEVIVASVPVHQDPRGTSVIDLLTEIETLVEDAALRSKLRQTVFRVGGATLAQGALQRFDRRAASEGLRYFRASEVPAIEERPPSEVLEVRLRIRCRDVLGEDLAGAIELALSA